VTATAVGRAPVELPGVTLRSRAEGDDDFLLALYVSTRGDVALFGWDDATVRQFLVGQFGAQEQSYGTAHPAARSDVVLVGGVRAGRLLTDRRRERIDLVDVALLPEHRGRGIGNGLVRSLCREAADAGLPVRLQVRVGNPAEGLYERLGFVADRSTTASGAPEMYRTMEWRAS